MGAAVAHFGIRYANDLTSEYSEYVVDSVDLLNAQLAPHASIGEQLESYNSYVCASWEDRGGKPYAAIDGELPEEAYA